MIDSALLAAIAWHIALGVLLLGAIWWVGTAWMRLLLDPAGELSPQSRAAFAYAVGLFGVVVVSIVALASPGIGIVAAVAIAGPAVRERVRAWSGAVRVRVPWRPLVVVLAAVPITVALAILWHAPGASWDSYDGADAFFFGGRAIAALRSVYPVHNLLVAGSDQTALEMGPSYLAAALERWFGGDVFLVSAATLPIVLAGSLLLCLRPITRRGASAAVPLGLLLAFAVLSPSSLPTSPPIALAVPLAFALLALLEERLVRPRSLAIVIVALALDLALTKVVGLLVLALVLCAILRRSPLGGTAKVGIAVVAIAVLGGLSIGYVATRSSYLLALEWHFSTPLSNLPSWHAVRSGYAIDKLGVPTRALGEIALLLTAWRLRSRTLLFIFGACVVFEFFVSSFSKVTPLALAVTMLVGWLAARPDDAARAYPWLTLSAVFLGTSSWLIDPEPPSLALTLFALLLGAMVTAVLLAAPQAPSIRSGAVARPAAMVAALLLCGLAFHSALGAALAVAMTLTLAFLPTVGRGRTQRPIAAVSVVTVALVLGLGTARSIRVRDFGWQLRPQGFVHDDFAVWHAVEERTPASSLVFTNYYRVHGALSSYYAATGRRQIYFGAWQYTSLQADDAARARILARNEEVLAGTVAPSQVAGVRHGPFFAVLTAQTAPPPSFTRIYGNTRYVLYRIAAAGGISQAGPEGRPGALPATASAASRPSPRPAVGAPTHGRSRPG